MGKIHMGPKEITMGEVKMVVPEKEQSSLPVVFQESPEKIILKQDNRIRSYIRKARKNLKTEIQAIRKDLKELKDQEPKKETIIKEEHHHHTSTEIVQSEACQGCQALSIKMDHLENKLDILSSTPSNVSEIVRVQEVKNRLHPGLIAFCIILTIVNIVLLLK